MARSMVRWVPELPSNPHDEIFALVIACIDLDSDDVHALRHLLGFPIARYEVTLIVGPVLVDHCYACVRLHSETNDANILNHSHADFLDCCEWTQEYCFLISVAHRRSVLEPLALDSIREAKLQATQELHVFVSTFPKVYIELVLLHFVFYLRETHVCFTNRQE